MVALRTDRPAPAEKRFAEIAKIPARDDRSTAQTAAPKASRKAAEGGDARRPRYGARRPPRAAGRQPAGAELPLTGLTGPVGRDPRGREGHVTVERLADLAQPPLPVAQGPPLVGQPGGGGLGEGDVDRLLGGGAGAERLAARAPRAEGVVQVVAEDPHPPRVDRDVVDDEVDPAHAPALRVQYGLDGPLLADPEAGAPPRGVEPPPEGRLVLHHLDHVVQPVVDRAHVLAAVLAARAADQRPQSLVPGEDVAYRRGDLAGGQVPPRYGGADVVLVGGVRVGGDPLDPLVLSPGERSVAHHPRVRRPAGSGQQSPRLRISGISPRGRKLQNGSDETASGGRERRGRPSGPGPVRFREPRFRPRGHPEAAWRWNSDSGAAIPPARPLADNDQTLPARARSTFRTPPSRFGHRQLVSGNMMSAARPVAERAERAVRSEVSASPRRRLRYPRLNV